MAEASDALAWRSSSFTLCHRRQRGRVLLQPVRNPLVQLCPADQVAELGNARMGYKVGHEKAPLWHEANGVSPACRAGELNGDGMGLDPAVFSDVENVAQRQLVLLEEIG